MNHSETEGDGTDREMCIGQSRDGVGTKGERERKRRKTLLWRWEEREQRMHVIQLRNATRMMTDEIKSVSQLGRESSLIFHAARDGLELLPWLRILITPESHSFLRHPCAPSRSALAPLTLLRPPRRLGAISRFPLLVVVGHLTPPRNATWCSRSRQSQIP